MPFDDMIHSGNLSLDQRTGVIYRSLWSSLGDGDREWDGHERVSQHDAEDSEVADYEHLRDIWDDGNRNTVDDF